ncbi:MAG: TIGR00725 family protein [Nitrospinota bacterium]|nr:TIGR00725 family protein [Nitrospinota bacterium]
MNAYGKPVIGVIGASRPTGEAYDLARVVGRKIAERGGVVVCGGLGGVMEAACRGAKEGGGLTIGILPGQDAGEANRFVDVPIVTGMGYARNIIIVRTAQAIIALDGSFGTLSELAHALQMAKPLVAVGCRIAPPEAPQVEDPEEAVARACAACADR